MTIRGNKILGLPVRGVMATEPAASVGAVMGVVALVVSIVVQVGGGTIPPDVQDYADQYGALLVGAAIGLYSLVHGYITRSKVIAPATAAHMVEAVSEHPNRTASYVTV